MLAVNVAFSIAQYLVVVSAADGVQLIYWAPLAPVIVPILFLTRAKDH